MNNKVMHVLGIAFTVVGVLSLVGAVVMWFLNYYFMQEGFYEYGEPLMITMTILGFAGLLIYPGIPLLIVSTIRKNRQQTAANPQQMAIYPQQVAEYPNQTATYPQQAAYPQQTVVNPQPAPAQVSYKYCVYCGTKLNANANFCSQCGKRN